MLDPSRASLKGKERQIITRNTQSGTLEHNSEGLGRRSRNSRGSTSSTLAGNQPSTREPHELAGSTEPRGNTDKEVVTATDLKSPRPLDAGEGSSRRSSGRGGARQSSSSSKSARTSSSTSATSLSSNQTYSHQESESSIRARIRTNEAALQSLLLKQVTLQELAVLEGESRKAKVKLRDAVWDKNTTHKTYNESKTEKNREAWEAACHAHKTAERNETRRTSAFTRALEHAREKERALKEDDLSLNHLDGQSLTARLGKLDERIRELKRQLLNDREALGRRKKAASDPPESRASTGAKSATPRKRSRSPHESTESGRDSMEGAKGKTIDGEKKATKDRGEKETKHVFVRDSTSGRFSRVEHEVPKRSLWRFRFGRDGK